MEKTYSPKYLEVLYYDFKLLPVVMEKQDNGMVLKFVLNKNSKMKVLKRENVVATMNKGAQSCILLETTIGEKRYGEIGSLLSTISVYGKKLVFENNKLCCLNGALNNNHNGEAVANYFNLEFTADELKEIFTELNKVYNKKTSWIKE